MKEWRQNPEKVLKFTIVWPPRRALIEQTAAVMKFVFQRTSRSIFEVVDNLISKPFSLYSFPYK